LINLKLIEDLVIQTIKCIARIWSTRMRTHTQKEKTNKLRKNNWNLRKFTKQELKKNWQETFKTLKINNLRWMLTVWQIWEMLRIKEVLSLDKLKEKKRSWAIKMKTLVINSIRIRTNRNRNNKDKVLIRKCQTIEKTILSTIEISERVNKV